MASDVCAVVDCSSVGAREVVEFSFPCMSVCGSSAASIKCSWLSMPSLDSVSCRGCVICSSTVLSVGYWGVASAATGASVLI